MIGSTRRDEECPAWATTPHPGSCSPSPPAEDCSMRRVGKPAPARRAADRGVTPMGRDHGARQAARRHAGAHHRRTTRPTAGGCPGLELLGLAAARAPRPGPRGRAGSWPGRSHPGRRAPPLWHRVSAPEADRWYWRRGAERDPAGCWRTRWASDESRVDCHPSRSSPDDAPALAAGRDPDRGERVGGKRRLAKCPAAIHLPTLLHYTTSSCPNRLTAAVGAGRTATVWSASVRGWPTGGTRRGPPAAVAGRAQKLLSGPPPAPSGSWGYPDHRQPALTHPRCSTRARPTPSSITLTPYVVWLTRARSSFPSPRRAPGWAARSASALDYAHASPRHKARKHPAPRRQGDGGRLRHRPRGEGSGRHPAYRDRPLPRDAEYTSPQQAPATDSYRASDIYSLAAARDSRRSPAAPAVPGFNCRAGDRGQGDDRPGDAAHRLARPCRPPSPPPCTARSPSGRPTGSGGDAWRRRWPAAPRRLHSGATANRSGRSRPVRGDGPARQRCCRGGRGRAGRARVAHG